MTKVNRLNSNTPFLQGVPNSLISREWFLVLNAIVTVLGSGQDVNNIIEISDLITMPTVSVDNTNTISTILQQLAMMNTLIQNNQQMQDRIVKLELQLQNMGKQQNSSDPLLTNLISTVRGANAYQISQVSGGAVATTLATNIAPYGYSSTQANQIVTLVNNIRQALILNSIMS